MTGTTRATSAHRITNLTHSEIAQCLPLPGPPLAFGPINHPVFLYDDVDSPIKLHLSSTSTVLSHAVKITELLTSTDINYLSLRHRTKSTAIGISTGHGCLLEAILVSEPDAFSYTLPVIAKRRSTRSFTSSNKGSQVPVVTPNETHSGSSSNATHQSSPVSEENAVGTPVSARRTRMRRRDAAVVKQDNDSKHLLPLDSGKLVTHLCENLDDLFERTDVPGEDEPDDTGSYLSLTELKMMAENFVNLRAKNALHLVPMTHIVKVLTLLDRHIQHANAGRVGDETDLHSENFSAVMSALEAVQISLLIITVPSMPKQVYKEEIIDRIIEFTRYHIVYTVFTAYDPMYRQLHNTSSRPIDEDDEDEDEDYENAAGSSKKGRLRAKSTRVKKATTSRVSGSTSDILHKLCRILGLLKDLLAVERLPDSTVLQLTKTVLATLAIDNIQLLQLKAIGVACKVFDLYSQHRTMIFDEIISLLWKLPSSKRSIRTFHLQDEEQPKQIQMLTAILLQLVQCSVTLPSLDISQSSPPEKPSSPTRCFESAIEASNYFWRVVLQRWAAPKAQEGADIKAVVENLAVDLLTTLNVPEFPASSLLLQVLCILLFGPVGLKAKDAGVRGAAIDLLGQVAARLKHDAVCYTNNKLWILDNMHQPGDNTPGDETLKKNCVICYKGKENQFMVTCNDCCRWFHGDCIGVMAHDLLGRGWLCLYCLYKRQLASLRSNSKPTVTEDPALSSDKKLDDTSTSSKEGLAIIQQILLNHLQEADASDGLTSYAHRFYLCQWYRDEEHGFENLQFYHSRSTSKAPLQDFGSVPSPLSRSAIMRISGFLGQHRPLARGFDRILERLLASLQENSPTPRAKALRAVSAMVEVYPDVLGDERVQRAVEGRFLDSAISVREAAMELVGRHIVSRPDFALKYFEKIAERIMDTGVSVRKRVIKIIRDVCLSNSGFSKLTEGCVRIISRINDEESSIQDLVGKTFYEFWFEDQSGQPTEYFDEGVVPLAICERTQQLVDVLRSMPNNGAMVSIIKRSLALDFCPQAMKNVVSGPVMQAAVRNRCQLMCKCLLESILKAEETSTEDAEVQALPYIMALHAFCQVDATLCAPPSDPSRYAATLQPYLKTQVDNRNAAQLLQSIVFVIDTVLPLLRRPPQNLVAELERDLRQLIVRYSFLTVVYACIKCLCSLTKVAPKGLNSFEFLVKRFFKLLDMWRKDHFEPSEKSNVLRYLFCLGVLVRFGSWLIESMDDNEVNLRKILGLYNHYLLCEDIDVKAKALQAIGYVFIAQPNFMMEAQIGSILEDSLSISAEPRIKMQSLRNFSDYLLDVEEKMGVTESGGDGCEKRDGGGAVPVAAGAGDSNICGGIIQLHWDRILECCLDRNSQVRHASLKVVEIVLRQGLVHPMTCVPQLIAMEVDQWEGNSKLAHRLLVQLNEKYPSFLESRLGDGLLLSFSFMQSGAAFSSSSVTQAQGPADEKLAVEQSKRKMGHLGISQIYKLIRGSRNARNKFLSSITRKFDSAASGIMSSIPFLVYCAEIVSSLPFGSPDEPLYIVFSINRVVQVRGGVLEANMKSSITDGPLGIAAKKILGFMAVEKEREGEQAYDMSPLEANISKGAVEGIDDTEGIPDDALDTLRIHCNAAIALALLLRLKRHLKMAYGLSDIRCQTFSPTEPIKSGDAFTRRECTKPYSTHGLPIEPATTMRQMLEQYQAFKRLLKEDAMDYSIYTANISAKKRSRVVANNEETFEGSQANEPPPPAPTRILRKRNPISGVSEEIDLESEDEQSDEWEDKSKKRKRGRPPLVRGRGSKKNFVTP